MTRPRALGVLALTVAMVAVACSGGHPRPAPPPVTATTVPSTTAPDYSTHSLAVVAGQTTIVVKLTPGKATINGQVVDDTGAVVPGAIVHLERVVGGQSAAADIAAGTDGSYVAQGVLGGLYRVRAWRLPDLALVNPQVFFLGADQTITANLSLQRYTGMKVTASIAPNPPIIDQPANLVVEVATSNVGTDGVVRGTGRPGIEVDLVVGSGWVLSGSQTATSDGAGLVTWQVMCTDFNAQQLSVVVDRTQSFPLTLPQCAPVPPTTTTALATTTTPSSTTSTTRKVR